MTDELMDLTRRFAADTGMLRDELGRPRGVSWFQLQMIVRAAVEHGKAVMLESGDTCARQCEGTAYRIEAQNLRREVDMLHGQAGVLVSLLREADAVLSTIEDDDGGELLHGLRERIGKATSLPAEYPQMELM